MSQISLWMLYCFPNDLFERVCLNCVRLGVRMWCECREKPTGDFELARSSSKRESLAYLFRLGADQSACLIAGWSTNDLLSCKMIAMYALTK